MIMDTNKPVAMMTLGELLEAIRPIVREEVAKASQPRQEETVYPSLGAFAQSIGKSTRTASRIVRDNPCTVKRLGRTIVVSSHLLFNK